MLGLIIATAIAAVICYYFDKITEKKYRSFRQVVSVFAMVFTLIYFFVNPLDAFLRICLMIIIMTAVSHSMNWYRRKKEEMRLEKLFRETH